MPSQTSRLYTVFEDTAFDELDTDSMATCVSDFENAKASILATDFENTQLDPYDAPTLKRDPERHVDRV